MAGGALHLGLDGLLEVLQGVGGEVEGEGDVSEEQVLTEEDAGHGVGAAAVLVHGVGVVDEPELGAGQEPAHGAIVGWGQECPGVAARRRLQLEGLGQTCGAGEL